METLQKIKEYVELMSSEAHKVYDKGNRSAATRARKHAQEIKNLLNDFRKELLEKTKK
jgi:hypothetical protein